MKILFVHLSDIHISNNFEVNSIKSTRLTNAIKSQLSKADECIVICSGDIANTADINEYKKARRFFGKILAAIGTELDKYVYILMVPGNHDLYLPEGCRKAEDILGYYKENIKERFNDELKRNSHFFDYANSKKCFKDSQIISNRILDFDKYRIQINLINTSPFSTRKPDDKQIHFLPSYEMYKLQKKDNISLAITVMHHSPEWFNYETKLELENVLYSNSDIAFIGHEHIINSDNVIRRNKKRIKISRGGEYSGEYSKESEFLTFLLDTKNKTFEEILFKWDKSNNIFLEEERNDATLLINANSFKNSESFLKEFYCDNQGLRSSCLDYYVFPELITKSYDYEYADNNYKTVTKKEFLEELNKNKISHIISPAENGKTTLLKYLYSYYLEIGCVPLYFSEINYNSKLDRIEKYLFENQYSEKKSELDNYKQLDKSKKVILIDNYDRLANDHQRKNLLSYFESEADTIIISSNKINTADILANIKNAIQNKYEIKTFEINKFYKRKRSELIRNVCKTNPSLDGTAIDSIVEIMNKLVQSKTDMFVLSPSSLIQYIKYFMNTNTEDNKDDAVFLEILQNNIVNLLRENIRDSDIQEYINQLEELAYFMHFNSMPIISHQVLNDQIENYNKEMWLKTNTNDLITKLQKANILCKDMQINHYRFKNKNYFAYFVARKMERNINTAENASDFERNNKDINFLAKNICFTINDRILMFLTNIKSNTNFIIKLCNELPILLEDFDEVDLDNYNIDLFHRAYIENISIPTKEEKELIERAEEKTEIIKKTNEDDISFIDEYNYNEKDINKFPHNINRAIKYMEIISKSFVSQFSILNKEKKESISKTLFSAPNKIIYSILKPLDDDFEAFINFSYEIINDIKRKEAYSKNMKFKEITKTEIEEFLIDTARAITLSIYDQIAFHSATSKTIGVLEMFSDEKGSSQIQKLLMISNGKNTKEFIEEAINLLNQYPDNLLIKTFIKLVVRVYVIRRPELSYRYVDRICSSILGKSHKKELLLLQNRK